MDNIKATFVDAKKSDQLTDLNGNNKNDVILSVDVEFEKKGVSIRKTIKLNIDDLSESFLPLEEISQDSMLQWAMDSLTEKQKFGIEKVLDKAIRISERNLNKETPVIKNIVDLSKVKQNS